MVKFLDTIAETRKEGFDRLMDLFVAKQLPWLRDEMYTDYLAEKGDLKVEVSCEANSGWAHDVNHKLG